MNTKVTPRVRPVCKLCGGNSGQLDTDGAHCLCTALAREGLPTPCLGYACEACNGNGHTIKAGQGVAFPKCAACSFDAALDRARRVAVEKKRKDTDKQEHEDRCAAIVAHMEVAERLKDRRFAEVAHNLTRRLDDRRKTPWGSHMAIFARGLEIPAVTDQRFGTFAVSFQSGYGDGIAYRVDRVLGKKTTREGEEYEDTELIAELPILASFDPQKTADEIAIAHARAEAIARMLEDCDHNLRTRTMTVKP